MHGLQVSVGELTFDGITTGPEDGELVVFLHCFPESCHEWAEVMPLVAEAGYRCLAFDQRGYSPGACPPEVEAYHHRRLAADVLGVADALGVERFHLVGHDWGALVAWSVAASTPERLRTLTVVSVPHPRAFAHARAHDPEQKEKSQYIGFFATPEVPEQLFLADEAAGLRRALDEMDDDTVEVHVATLQAPGAMTGALNYYRAWDRSLDEIGPVSVPTLFVWSTEDVAIARAGAEATGEWVTGPYRLEVFDGLSHWLPEIVPERVAALVIEQVSLPLV
jgi:pimeloyl-ACP methyl ester carboxylesterase